MAILAPQRSPRKPAQTRELRPAPLPALTGLRILASVLVVLFHFLPLGRAPGVGPWPWLTGVVARIVASGYTGVSFFFVLSGFILTYSYLNREGRLRGAVGRFYWARVARIYPIYLCSLLLGLVPVLQAFAPGFTDSRFIPGMALSPLLLQGWLPYAPIWNPPSWSLSAEVFFYALFPLIVPLIGRLSRRRLPLAALAFWGVSVLVVVAYVAIDPDRGQSGAWYDHYWLRILYDNPLARLPEFLLGAVAGRLFATRMTRAGSTRPRISPAWLSLGAGAVIVAVWSLGPFPVALVNQIVLDPLFAVLVYSLAFGRGPLAALFSWPAVVLLGEASYALYLLQWPVHSWLARLYGTPPMHALPAGERPFVFFVAYLCVAIVLALLSYRFVERPARRAIRRLSERGFSSGAASAEAGAAARPHAREAAEG